MRLILRRPSPACPNAAGPVPDEDAAAKSVGQDRMAMAYGVPGRPGKEKVRAALLATGRLDKASSAVMP